jgi:hypothetical protein
VTYFLVQEVNGISSGPSSITAFGVNDVEVTESATILLIS